VNKILLAGGDSFTWGNELSDFTPDKPSNISWAALLAKKLNYTYDCVAKAGCGNHAIARKIIERCDNTNVDFVAVMWTFPVRQELSIRSDLVKQGHDIELVKHELDGNWINLVHWQGIDYEEKLSNFGEISKDISFQKKLEHQCNWHKQTGIYDIARYWFNIASREYHDQITLESIIVLQSYLEKHNIPFVFSSSTNQIFDLLNSDHPLAKIVNRNHWIANIGFYDWAKINGYKLSPMQHPEDRAHVDWIENFYK
jgi:hypothetical protein